MIGELFFGLRMKYLLTEFEPLKRLVVCKPIYNYDDKTYLWLFPYSKIKEVEALVGTITIPGFKEGFKKEKIKIPEWKGKDSVEVTETPQTFVISGHRKVETKDGSKVMPWHYEVGKETVAAVWTVIKKQPKFKAIKSRTVAKNIMEFLGIIRFHRSDTGSWDFARFFGNRSDYFHLFHYPLHVLQHHRCIKYHKKGAVERLTDEWVMPTQFKKVKQ